MVEMEQIQKRVEELKQLLRDNSLDLKVIEHEIEIVEENVKELNQIKKGIQ